MSIDNRNTIEFYRARGTYGYLSNLYKKPIKFEGIIFPTSEHAYQYGKFKDQEVRDWAMKSPKPHLLSILAHGLFSWDIVPNWSKIKVKRMYNILKVKFSDPDLRMKLLNTGESILIENSKSDSFWGIGKNRKGKNKLGKLLKKIREEIREELEFLRKELNICDNCKYDVPTSQECLDCQLEYFKLNKKEKECEPLD